MQRKNELSFLNIIFCLLVVFIHVSSAPISDLEKGGTEYALFFVPWRLSAFVVQGFIFLSGLKMFLKKDNGGYIKYCIGRFKSIVIPYVLAVLLFYAFFLWRKYFAFDTKELFGYIVTGDLVSHFYFVIVIVQFYILKPLWQAIVRKISPKIAIIASILIMFFCKYSLSGFLYNDRLFTTYLTYWIIGCYTGENYDKVLVHLKKYKVAYICQYFLVAIAEAVVSYTHFVYGGMKLLEELHFAYCISAIMFTFAISLLLGRPAMKIKFFEKIDKSSYEIYLIHPLFIFITNELLKLWGIGNVISGFLVRCVITYCVSIFVSVSYLEAKGIIKAKRKEVKRDK